MNTNGLAKYYGHLTPWERLPLIVAASVRGDAAESDRLARAAPQLGVRLPNYWGLAEGLRDLAVIHVLEQLDLTVTFRETVSVLERDSQLLDTKRARKREKRLWEVAKTVAYRFVVLAGAWKHVEHEAPHRRGGIKLLGHGYEGDVVLVEGLHHFGEVEQGPAQAVHFVNHDRLDLACRDVGEESSQRGPIHIATGEATVVVTVGRTNPTLVPLAGDVRLGRLPLCV